MAGAAATFPKIKARLELSRAKHRSLTGHSKMSRRVARLLPFYEFSGDQYFNADGAPAEIASQRKDAFFALAKLYAERYAKGRQMTAEAVTHISDLQFTRAYRVPFQFSSLVQKNLGTSAFMESSSGVTVTDVDGNLFYDLTGSYGVNIFGNDFYKECIAEGEKRAEKLGPVLGSYHPVVADNVKRICEISGLRTKSPSTCPAPRPSCRRCGLRATTPSGRIWFALPAPITAGGATCSRASAIRSPPHETYTLAEMSEKTLHVLRTRRDIACVLVNPLQALHPNANAPGDSALVDSSRNCAFRPRGLYRLAEATARGLRPSAASC